MKRSVQIIVNFWFKTEPNFYMLLLSLNTEFKNVAYL